MRSRLGFAALIAVVIATVAAGLVLGPADITLEEVWLALTGQPTRPVAKLIVMEVRLPRTVTACLAGAALGVAGLMMQTLFRNPLADPFILGISAGASLGVAAVILVIGTATTASLTAGLGLGGDVVIILAAALGAGGVMLLVLALGQVVRSVVTVLLIGVMVGYLVSAGVSVMMSMSTNELVVAFARWQFGSYAGVTWDNLRVIAAVVAAGLIFTITLSKPLNTLLLGERYAQTLGLRVRAVRTSLIAVSSLLAGAITAFCGPIQFIGLAVPHLARGIFNTANHRTLIPATILLGAVMALLADIISVLPGDGVLPLNAVNAAFGAPVVIWLLLNRRRQEL